MQSFWKDSLNAKNIFLQMSQLPHQKACYDPWWALFPLIANGQMYYGYCINCLYPAMGEA
jgi:hypothetical protein